MTTISIDLSSLDESHQGEAYVRLDKAFDTMSIIINQTAQAKICKIKKTGFLFSLKHSDRLIFSDKTIEAIFGYTLLRNFQEVELREQVRKLLIIVKE